MRADDVCRVCGAPVRTAVRQLDGRPVLLNHRADVDADVGIVGWQPTSKPGWRTPVVSIVTSAAKTETPMRYTIHDCHA